MMQFVTSGELVVSLYIAPPLPPAELPLSVQLINVGEELASYTAPPSNVAEFSLITQFFIVGEESTLQMAPPLLASFSMKKQLVTVGDEPLQSYNPAPS
jgi:hypothetical protein